MRIVRQAAKAIAILLLGFAVFTGLWWHAYPKNDVHSIDYKLWKLGYPTMGYEMAVRLMVDDPDAESQLIVGKTRAELARRLQLDPPEKASAYDQYCYRHSVLKTRPALFLHDTHSFIVFQEGKATGIYDTDGC